LTKLHHSPLVEFKDLLGYMYMEMQQSKFYLYN
jgi:hypothetical protein